MSVFGRMGLVPKLAILTGLSMVLMVGTLTVGLVRLSGEAARETAELQIRMATRVLQESAARSAGRDRPEGEPPAQVASGSRRGLAPDLTQDVIDRLSRESGAAVTVLEFDAAAGAFRRLRTSLRAQDRADAAGTLLDVDGPVHAALAAGTAFEGETQVLGEPHLGLYRPVTSANGEVVGAIGAAVPRVTGSEAVRGIATRLAGWLALSLAIGISASLAALVLLLGPLRQTAAAVVAMARKDYGVEPPEAPRNDEVGRIARAVGKLRDDLAGADRLAADARSGELERERQRLEQLRVVDELRDALARLAEGDLTRRIDSPADNPFPETYGALRESYNTAAERVGAVMTRVTAIAEEVRTGSRAISQASRDLSSRTESQAATLEESAAALNELTASVASTAEGAAGAEAASEQNRDGAETGAAVVGQAVEAMRGIERSSEQITRIVDVIEDIAFQTNLLALNAGVEAARAGEAGRGFSVVASEVRLLAQRASESAREIKELISESAKQVEGGSSLVHKAGESLSEILDRAQQAASLVAGIASAASEQANGLKEVNTGINQLDHATQQNRAVAEETTASASDLLAQSDALIAALAEFHVNGAPAPTDAAPAATSGSSAAVDVTPRVADWEAAAAAAANTPRATPPAAGAGGSWHEF